MLDAVPYAEGELRVMLPYRALSVDSLATVRSEYVPVLLVAWGGGGVPAPTGLYVPPAAYARPGGAAAPYRVSVKEKEEE
jgi:hypothetical protein